MHYNESDYDQLFSTVAKRERICNKTLLLYDKSDDVVDVLFSTEFIELDGTAVLLVMMVDITLEGTSKNLLRSPIASLGGARNPHVQCVHSGFFAPSALHSARS